MADLDSGGSVGGVGGGDGRDGWGAALLRKHGNTAQIGVAASVGYLITYFIRYPMFSNPNLPKGAVGGTRMDLKTWFSLASTIGFGLSKIPAYRVVSQMNRGYRFQLLLGQSTPQPAHLLVPPAAASLLLPGPGGFRGLRCTEI